MVGISFCARGKTVTVVHNFLTDPYPFPYPSLPPHPNWRFAERGLALVADLAAALGDQPADAGGRVQ